MAYEQNEVTPSQRERKILSFLSENLPDGFAYVLLAIPRMKDGDLVNGKLLKVFSNDDKQMPFIVKMASMTIPGAMPRIDRGPPEIEDEGEGWKKG